MILTRHVMHLMKTEASRANYIEYKKHRVGYILFATSPPTTQKNILSKGRHKVADV